MEKLIFRENLMLRPARLYDSLILYKWVMDVEARNNSINSDKFSFEHHYEWLQKKLENRDCRIFIMESFCPLGQIRFEKEMNLWIVSYSIDENFRNQGMGQQIIKMGLELMGSGQYLARVKKSNIPSIKIFLKLNFLEMKKEFEDQDIINFLYQKE